jgi:phosphatidylinositol glycan class U
MYIIILVLKCALYLYGKWDTDLTWIPYFTTPYTRFSNIDEARYLKENNYNPYDTDGIFQKPILVYGLMNIDSKLVYLIVDIVIGFLIANLFG